MSNETKRNEYEDLVTCPCGHRFEITRGSQLRGYGGKWLNKSTERSSMDSNFEVQCPKCLLWFDSMSEEINL